MLVRSHAKNHIIEGDLAHIFEALGKKEREKFKDSRILITGCAGFLGFYFLHFLARFAGELGVKKIIGLDNFMLRTPRFIEDLTRECGDLLEIRRFDIIKDDIAAIPSAAEADFVVHMASIASPTFYRRYPIETIDANIWGLRNLLEFYKTAPIRGFLFFSSSEIYGDALEVPTNEEYRGNVACVGPRACYDEAKRFGETMCYLFSQKYALPISIVRPFNNYGPGMSVEDKRVPADFARAVLEGRDIEILSDGSPKRTFCYIADAIAGYLKALVCGEFDYFNIGSDEREISIEELARIYQAAGREILGYGGAIKRGESNDRNYLTHNPTRRCPNLAKARERLGYAPSIGLESGVRRFLEFLKLENENTNENARRESRGKSSSESGGESNRESSAAKTGSAKTGGAK